MERSELKEKILEFIKGHEIGVIATVDPLARPEAAAVEYGETDNLELIFDAFTSSRKCKNLKNNPYVAFVIGWDENITLQYEGIAQELVGEELNKCKEIYFEKNIRAKKWDSREGIIYFKINPKWVRYSNLNKDPWEVLEMDL